MSIKKYFEIIIHTYGLHDREYNLRTSLQFDLSDIAFSISIEEIL